jgi:hypothetical protein
LSRHQSHVLREARQFASPGSHPLRQMRWWTRVMRSRAVRVLSNGRGDPRLGKPTRAIKGCVGCGTH